MPARGGAAACLWQAQALQKVSHVLRRRLHALLWQGAQHLAQPADDVSDGISILASKLQAPLTQQLCHLWSMPG